MKKGLTVAVLAGILIGSLMLLKKRKTVDKTAVVSSETTFRINAPNAADPEYKVKYWIHEGKYYTQCMSKIARCHVTEITKEQYDKAYQDYLN